MQHYDGETLALLALGEAGATVDDEAHLARCPRCQSDVDQLAAVVSAGRSIAASDYPIAPPARVWDRISAEAHSPATDAGAGNNNVVAIGSHRGQARRSRWLLLVAAAAVIGLVLGSLGTVLLTKTTSQQAAASFKLTPVSVASARGTAYLTPSGSAQRSITVQVSGLPVPAGGYYEVWLMNASPVRFVALGVLDVHHAGIFQIPAGLDLSGYPYLDVSLQPFNGSPIHSGDSVVRGSISF